VCVCVCVCVWRVISVVRGGFRVRLRGSSGPSLSDSDLPRRHKHSVITTELPTYLPTKHSVTVGQSYLRATEALELPTYLPNTLSKTYNKQYTVGQSYLRATEALELPTYLPNNELESL
jgi:hypothetical protein